MNSIASVTVAPARVFKALSSADLRRCAPSVFAEHARPGVSARYTFVSTAQVVDLLGAEGWLPVRACQQRVRLEDRSGYQMHEIRFARRSDLESGVLQVGSTRPEMILQNAHDGTRAYRIDAGLYRLVCRNGLTVADTDFVHVSIRHMDGFRGGVCQGGAIGGGEHAGALEAVARWQAIPLSQAARLEFARRAAALRWDASSPILQALTPEKLLSPLRYGDAATDLWTTFNVVQEHLERGGDRYLARSPNVGLRRNRTRPVAGLAEGQKLNKALWALAGTFARN